MKTDPKKSTKQKIEVAARVVARKANTLVFTKLIIENAYTFSGVNTIPLNNTGLVKVTGINRDTKTISSNGAGKTRAWHCMLRLLYGRKAMKKEKPTDAYDMDNGNFRIEIHFDKGGHSYIVRETKKHKEYGDGLRVFCDGKPWGAKNEPELLRKEVQAVLNRSYEEFVGTVIWKQNAEHVLVEGTPAERSKWVSDFFGLAVYDEMFSAFSLKYDQIKSQVAKHADTRARAKVLQESLSAAGNVDDIRSSVKLVKASVAKLIEKSDSNTAMINKLREKESDLKHLAELKSQIDEEDAGDKKSSDIANVIAKSKLELSELQAKIKLASESESVSSKYRTAKKRAAASKDKLLLLYQQVFKGDGQVPTTSDLKPMQIAAAERSAVLKATLIRSKKTTIANAESIKAMRRLDDLGYADCDMKYLKEMRKVHQDEIMSFEKSVSKSEAILEREVILNDHIVKCPTCGTKVDAKLIKQDIELARGRIADAKASIKSNKKELTEFEEAIGLREIADRKITGEDIDCKVVEAKIERLELKTLALVKMLEFAADYEHYSKIQKNLKAEYIESKKLSGFNVEDASKEIAGLEDALERLVILKSNIETYERITSEYKLVETADLELSATKRKRSALEERNSEFSEKLTTKRIRLDRMRKTIENFTAIQTEYSKLSDDLNTLKKLERKERIYKSLKKAYDKNGLKVRRLRELMKAIKSRLPIWTNILFTERNVSIDVTGNEKKIGFEITQKRKAADKHGKSILRSKTYDASEASGSEKTRISCALMLTMADVASSEKQCNLLVLDELERGLDSQSREIMSEEIIPLLKNKKPSLFLITHSLDIDPSNFDATLDITKSNQQSSVKFTRLHDIQAKHKKSKKLNKSTKSKGK